MALGNPAGKAMQWAKNPEKASHSAVDFSSGSRSRDPGRQQGGMRSETFPRTERAVPRPGLGMVRHWRRFTGAGGGSGASDGDRGRGPCQRTERFLTERRPARAPSGPGLGWCSHLRLAREETVTAAQSRARSLQPVALVFLLRSLALSPCLG